MTSYNKTTVGCLLVGEYVDEAEGPSDLPSRRGEPVRPRVVADYLDLWGKGDGLKEFTVLLRDGRVLAVRGQNLKLFPHSATGDGLHYGVVMRAADEEVVVALFRSAEVVGIFHGEVRSDRKIAS